MNLKNLFNETMLIDPDKMAIPNAWSGHIPFLAWLIATHKPNMYVELGTHNGTSYLAPCQAVAVNWLATKCFAVDTWLPKVSDREVNLFHDFAVHERGFGVWQLWAELKERYSSIEFEHTHGLGVLFVGAAIPDKLKLLLSDWASAQGRQSIVKLFSLLGQRISQQCELLELKPALADLDLQNHEFQLMVKSRSWRITKPLRWASGFLACLKK